MKGRSLFSNKLVWLRFRLIFAYGLSLVLLCSTAVKAEEDPLVLGLGDSLGEGFNLRTPVSGRSRLHTSPS